MTPSRGRVRAAALVVAALACAACGSSGHKQAGHGRVLRVPGSYKTIQAAVGAARPGDLVLIAAGVYHETVTVADEHTGIVIRGLDRNHVVLDGQNQLGDGLDIHADGVAVENLTVRRYLVNGVVWSPSSEYRGGEQLQGWRGSYITAYDNGLYGVYAFGAEHGRFDHVYASGQPDSGVYVGDCNPCHALVRDSVAEHNQVGYEATNASGDASVLDNVWTRNRVGVEIDSLRKEPGFPQQGSTLTSNRIVDNNDRGAPRAEQGGFGAGVAVNGGSANDVADNLVSGHSEVGIVVLDSPDSAATNNTVRANRLEANATDLALETQSGLSQGNCFSANQAPGGGLRSVPSRLHALTGNSCGHSLTIGHERLRLLPAPPQVSYQTLPAPPPQPNMPAAATAPAQPAVGAPERETAG
ncbi:MAG: right-handed parallel beta-helix repeat-containing protein [Solirubrobacterales bacterium]|nr:right-handed parallel beta-helix repeat-containing protein [Solirubrobacterales bacterium]